MRTAQSTLVLLAVALLAGCAIPHKALENRIVCTIDRSEAHVLSKYGPVSIGTQVSAADAAVVCGGKVKHRAAR